MRAPAFGRMAGLGIAGGALVAGAYLIVPHEGEVLRTYLDPIGVVTACYGQTGPELKPGQTFTRKECLAMLAEDLDEHQSDMLEVVDVPLTVNQHAAFLSFHYNVGAGNFRSSTLLKKLNQGDYVGACQEIPRWHYAGGKDCRKPENNCYGIVTRRADEMAMCLGQVDISEAYCPVEDENAL